MKVYLSFISYYYFCCCYYYCHHNNIITNITTATIFSVFTLSIVNVIVTYNILFVKVIVTYNILINTINRMRTKIFKAKLFDLSKRLRAYLGITHHLLLKSTSYLNDIKVSVFVTLFFAYFKR